ncbi:MAG TPA: four helix bundle protein [Candidatus Paceibacterota bacterium]
MNYDLEERTKRFSGEVIEALRMLERNEINKPLVSQCVRAATSVGANYREANSASSKKDFKNKIAICRKEVRETKYWLEVITEANKTQKETFAKLWQEAHELDLIFNKIYSSLGGFDRFDPTPDSLQISP